MDSGGVEGEEGEGSHPNPGHSVSPGQLGLAKVSGAALPGLLL